MPLVISIFETGNYRLRCAYSVRKLLLRQPVLGAKVVDRVRDVAIGTRQLYSLLPSGGVTEKAVNRAHRAGVGSS